MTTTLQRNNQASQGASYLIFVVLASVEEKVVIVSAGWHGVDRERGIHKVTMRLLDTSFFSWKKRQVSTQNTIMQLL